MSRPRIALVHDYLTQRGGAERVVLTLADAYPAAAIHTSLYDPEGTFPEFRDHTVVTSPLDRIGLLRTHHRLALPLLAPAFDHLHVDADVAICSSSGWAHGARVDGSQGRLLLHARPLALRPARPVPRRVVGTVGRRHRRHGPGPAQVGPSGRGHGRPLPRQLPRGAGPGGRCLRHRRRHRAATGGDRRRPRRPGRRPASSRASCSACPASSPTRTSGRSWRRSPDVPTNGWWSSGAGPLADELAATSPANVVLLGKVDDAELRWLYGACLGLVAASYEDFGLTPLEAAAFGRPTAALRWGGFLDTIVEGETGVLFDEPEPGAIAAAVDELVATPWSEQALVGHAAALLAGPVPRVGGRGRATDGAGRGPEGRLRRRRAP